MPFLYAFRLGPSCFLCDIDYVRNEHELREGGFRENRLEGDRLQVFNVPPLDLLPVRDYVHRRMEEQGAVIDKLIYSTTKWHDVQSIIQDYFASSIPHYPRIRPLIHMNKH